MELLWRVTFLYFFVPNLLLLEIIQMTRTSPVTGVGRKIIELCPENAKPIYVEGEPYYRYRYYNKTGSCHMLDERGVCGELMKFYRDEDTGYGDCDCDYDQKCGRSIVYWPATDRCYPIYSQGPCRTGQWLTFNEHTKPSCQNNPCLNLERMDPPRWDGNGVKQYWLTVDGKCWKTGTRGFCKNSDEKLFVWNGWQDFIPTCHTGFPCGLNSDLSIPCDIGSKADVINNCRASTAVIAEEKK